MELDVRELVNKNDRYETRLEKACFIFVKLNSSTATPYFVCTGQSIESILACRGASHSSTRCYALLKEALLQHVQTLTDISKLSSSTLGSNVSSENPSPTC